MLLKPQDVLAVLKLVAKGSTPWTYAQLAVELGMSPSQTHSAVKRAIAARLALHNGELIVPSMRNLEEFLIHGLKYAFVPEMGQMTRGIPTGYAAPPLNEHIVPGGEPPPVWPHPEGKTRGVSFSPLYSAAPDAARSDSNLYELLALVDAIRGGRVREREIGIRELKQRLKNYA